MVDVSVKIAGIRELSTAFKKIDADIAGDLKAKMLGVAQHVVGIAQQRMPIVSGRAAGSVKARGAVSGAAVAFGGTAAPYMPWLDFGGTTGRGHHTGGGGAITRPWLGNPAGEGRYVYPAISEARDDTAAAVDAAVKEAAEKAGFETKGGL